MRLFYKGQYQYYSVLIVQIMLMIDASFRLFEFETSQAISLLRYMMYFFGVYWMFKGIRLNHANIPLLYKVYLVWVLYILISALPELSNPMHNHIIFKSFISGKLYIYSLPFMICSDIDIPFFKKVLRLSYFMIIVYMVLAIPIYITHYGLLTSYTNEAITFLIEGAILILMTLPYQRKKTIITTLIAVIMAIVIMMLLARRNKVVYYGGGLGLAIILNVLIGKISSQKKALIVFSTLVGIVFLFNSGSIFDAFFNKMETGMSSREQVIDDFFSDFNRTPSDWIYGRGLFGEFDAGFLNNEETGLRDAIENGYLTLILKGGWIWLGLLILISIRSIYQGLFKSNNIFAKGCACIILLYYLDMVGFGVPVASLKYIMVFLSISVCTSRRWRNYTDNELKEQLAI